MVRVRPELRVFHSFTMETNHATQAEMDVGFRGVILSKV